MSRSIHCVVTLGSLLWLLCPRRVLDMLQRTNQVCGRRYRSLRGSSDALSYLARRRIDDTAAVTKFRLGYANRTLAYRLPQGNRKAGAELRGRLQRLGVIRSSGHEHFTGSLVVPVVTPAGQVAECYGRKIRDDLRPGTPLHLYLPGPHRGVWNEEACSSGEVNVTESLI